MEAPEQRRIRCIPFTPAKRQPPYVGDFFGYTGWPLPLTVFQFSTLAVVAIGMLFTWHLWGRFGMGNFLVYLGAVSGCTYATRQVRIQGRAPWAAGVGLVGSLIGRPRVNGKPYRAKTVTRYKASRMLLIPDETWKRYRFAIVASHHSQRRRFHLHRNYWQRRAS